MKSPSTLIIILFFLIFFGLFKDQNSQTIFITKLSDLDFGDVFIGYPAEVLITDPGAGKFSFFHRAPRPPLRRDIYISFNLPATLDNGPDSFPITFDALHTGWRRNDNPNVATNFDPHATLIIPNVRRNRRYYLWLGGQITTQPGLPYGLYSVTIILTVAY